MPGYHTHTTEAPMPSSGLLLSTYQFCIDLLFPPRCAGCGRVDTIWCIQCQYELDVIPVELHSRTVFKKLLIVSTGTHQGKLQQAVHALKYENIPGLRLPLAHRLMTAYHHLGWAVDIMVPVPMHVNRLARRGYNQAALLSLQLAKQLRLRNAPDGLKRIRETRSQVGLNRDERLTNVQDAFTGDPAILEGQRVLLIDDVCTSGATMTACAEVIMQHGAKEIFGLTVTTA